MWAERLHRRRGRRARAGRTVTVDGSKHFLKLPNNELYGGIRINLAGREPRGIVQPHEVDALVERLRADFLALRDPDDGRHHRARRVAHPRPLRRGRRHRRVARPPRRLGAVAADHRRREPHHRRGARRSTTASAPATIALGPRASCAARASPRARSPASVPVVNLAPTIAAMLGVTLDGVDGEPEPAFLAPAGRAQQ